MPLELDELKIDIAEIRKDIGFIKKKLEERFCEMDEHVNDYNALRDIVRNNAGFIKDLREQKKLSLTVKWWKVGVITGAIYFVINLIVFWMVKFLVIPK